jgi:hypothetical protein
LKALDETVAGGSGDCGVRPTKKPGKFAERILSDPDISQIARNGLDVK